MWDLGTLFIGNDGTCMMYVHNLQASGVPISASSTTAYVDYPLYVPIVKPEAEEKATISPFYQYIISLVKRITVCTTYITITSQSKQTMRMHQYRFG